MIETLPHGLSAEILAFCAEIAPARPQFIESKPAADAQIGFCFDNAARTVAQNGGSIAFGWAIWHLEGLYFEAEHHGVWQTEHGQLVDVSPQMNDYKTILFLPDDAAVYDSNNFRGNIMKPDGDSADAQEVVAISLHKNTILNSYRQPGVFSVTMSSDHQIEVDRLFSRIDEIVEARTKA